MTDREGLIVQLTGLSGAGKTTISNAVKDRMQEQGYRVAVVDGDVYRQTLCSDLGFNKEDRIANIQRLGRFAAALAPDFDLVLIAAINPYEEGRNYLREAYASPLVFLDCDLHTLVSRDPKGLYRRALLPADNPGHIPCFSGISDPYERPTSAELTLYTASISTEESAEELCDFLFSLLNSSSPDTQFEDFLNRFRSSVLTPDTEKSVDPDFRRAIRIFMAIFQLGTFDTYSFIYGSRDGAHFQSWLSERLGEEAYEQAISTFLKGLEPEPTTAYLHRLLTVDQLHFWQEQGYLQLSGLISAEDCDAVREVICQYLHVDLNNPKSWAPSTSRLQGIMVPSLNHEAIDRIRNHPVLHTVFADLYQQEDIYAIQAPLGYHPPESTGYAFRSSGLHWDIDFDAGARYHVQGLVYLQDVPATGGAFSLIPGYHKLLDDLLKTHGSPQAAMEALRNKGLEKYIAGKKGDLILWIEAMPHAATPNRSDRPRFVQYIGFEH